MTRTLLDKELCALDAQMVRMGALAENALAKALEALETDNQDESGAVIVADTVIDDLRTAIEEPALRVLILQQPLGGRDLRYLTSLLSITIDLERIGDEAEGIAQNVLRMMPFRRHPMQQSQGQDGSSDTGGGENEEAATLQDMLDLGQKVRYLFQQTMTLLEGAHAIPALRDDSHILQCETYLLWIALKLERVADHCANICERIVFIVEGEMEMQPPLD